MASSQTTYHLENKLPNKFIISKTLDPLQTKTGKHYF